MADGVVVADVARTVEVVASIEVEEADVEDTGVVESEPIVDEDCVDWEVGDEVEVYNRSHKRLFSMT